MLKRHITLLTAVVVTVIATPGFALLVGTNPGGFDPNGVNYSDGSIADWGVTGTPNAYDMPESFWQPTASGVSYWIEDSLTRVAGTNGYVGPGWGGQNFDIEAAYLGGTSGVLSMVIVTGFDRAGQWDWPGHNVLHKPGDIFFDVDRDGIPDVAVAVASRPGVTAGSVFIPKPAYRGGTWWTQTTDFSSSSPFQVRLSRAVLLGSDALLGFQYTNAVAGEYNRASSNPADWSPLDHNIIEIGLSLDAVRDSWNDLTIGTHVSGHWTMTCGNDVTDLTCDMIPEPATVALFLVGLPALAWARRRRAARP